MKRDIRFLPILLISSRGASTLHMHKIFGTQHLGFLCDQSSRDTRKKTNSGLCLLAKPRYQISSDSFDFLEIEKYYIPEASETSRLMSGLNLGRLKIRQFSTRSQSRSRQYPNNKAGFYCSSLGNPRLTNVNTSQTFNDLPLWVQHA
jgi:hypothetical protein